MFNISWARFSPRNWSKVGIETVKARKILTSSEAIDRVSREDRISSGMKLTWKLNDNNFGMGTKSVTNWYENEVWAVEIFLRLYTEKLLITAWKVFKYGLFSGPYFSAFGLNAKRYVSLRIQSKCGKTRTRKKLRIWTLHAVNTFSQKVISTFSFIWENLCELTDTRQNNFCLVQLAYTIDSKTWR